MPAALAALKKAADAINVPGKIILVVTTPFVSVITVGPSPAPNGEPDPPKKELNSLKLHRN
jgi:hypothetical protein